MSASPPRAVRSRASRAAALILGCGFALLAVLVSTGAVSGLDAYAIRHWSPGLETVLASESPSLTGALVPFYHRDSWTALDLAATVVTLPAYILVSTALFAAGVWLIARRGAIAEAMLWVAAFVAANVVEVTAKALLTRPELTTAGGVHLVAFDSSYPSGHALRTCLLAALLVRLRPSLLPATAVWTAAAVVLLVAAGVHTVTDVVGGVLLAGFLVALLVDLVSRDGGPLPAGRTSGPETRAGPASTRGARLARRRAGPGA